MEQARWPRIDAPRRSHHGQRRPDRGRARSVRRRDRRARRDASWLPLPR